jgi:AcrR family transcriptional regulator
LYFLFESKEALFRAAVERALEEDLAAAEQVLADTGKPFRGRLLDAFDRWAGRYVGPMSRDVAGVIEENPDLLGPIVETAPRRFEELLTDAIAEEVGRASAVDVARTLISASVGVKYQVQTREAYLERLSIAIGLLIA